MSLRHLKSSLTASCLVVAATLAAASAPLRSSSLSPEMIQPTPREGMVAFRGSGRFTHRDLLAYRASGRFDGGFFNRSLISYRGSERGVDALAYRASGRFHGGFERSLMAGLDSRAEQTLAYRASGRFHGGFDRSLISYRGSERGIDSLA